MCLRSPRRFGSPTTSTVSRVNPTGDGSCDVPDLCIKCTLLEVVTWWVIKVS